MFYVFFAGDLNACDDMTLYRTFVLVLHIGIVGKGNTVEGLKSPHDRITCGSCGENSALFCSQL